MLVAKKDLNHNGFLIKAGDVLPDEFNDEEKTELLGKGQADDKPEIVTPFKAKCPSCGQELPEAQQPKLKPKKQPVVEESVNPHLKEK